MYRITISGHRGLPPPTARLVDEAIRATLTRHAPDVTRISCLADGADQIFARRRHRPRRHPRSRHPRRQYRAGLPADTHPEYDDLLAQGAAVRRRLPFTESASESNMAASKLMVDGADELYAVWDGKPARACGGTADGVASAREQGRPVHVIWPDGAQRD
ncbi:MAG: hypothetical protein ACLQDY_12330 [Streptosporangiaceae bacterium]